MASFQHAVEDLKRKAPAVQENATVGLGFRDLGSCNVESAYFVMLSPRISIELWHEVRPDPDPIMKTSATKGFYRLTDSEFTWAA